MPEQPILRPKMPELDSIRGIAILLVLFYHGFFWWTGVTGLTGFAKVFVEATSAGWLGVNLFFVLSGFLITGILLDSKLKPRYFRDFYSRRALRILPAYLGILLVLLLVGLRPRAFLLLSVFFLANVAPLFRVVPSYNVLWSLAVEEHFYLLWPTVVHKLSRQTVGRCALWIALIVPALRAAAYLLGWTTGLREYTWFMADGLAMGAWLAAYLRTPELPRKKSLQVSAAAMGLGLVAIVAGAPAGILTRKTLTGAAFQVSCGNLVFLGVLGFSLLLGTGAWKFLVQRPVLSFYGYISYGLYLIHLLIFETYNRVVQVRWPVISPTPGRFGAAILRFVVCVGVSTALAYLSRRFFEDRFLRMKRRVAPADVVVAVHGALIRDTD